MSIPKRKRKPESEYIRKKAVGRMKELLILQDYKCKYCKEPIESYRRLSKRETVEYVKILHGAILEWKENGVVQRIKQATIDHILPISKGGGNHILNLCACCMLCNTKKEKESDSTELTVKCRICGNTAKKYRDLCRLCDSQRRNKLNKTLAELREKMNLSTEEIIDIALELFREKYAPQEHSL